MMSEERKRLTLEKDRRIRRRADFKALYRANMRRNAGPLLIYARPNELGHSRLAMAVSRRVGMAVLRNAVRRRIREAFRLAQHVLPGGYDLLVSVRPHEALKTDEYQRLLIEAANALHEKWKRRPQPDSPPPPHGR